MSDSSGARGQINCKSQMTDSADGNADSKYSGLRILRRPPVVEHGKFRGRPLPIVFQVLDCFDACNQREPIIAVRKRLAIQIDRVDPGTGNREQFIRVIAAKRTKRITRSNQSQQFPGSAANIEVVSARRHGRRGRDRAKDTLMNPRSA